MKMYAVTTNLPREQFDDLLFVLIESALDHFEDGDEETHSTYKVGGYETLAHQLSCLIAQRYNEGVGTGDTVVALRLDEVLPEDERKRLIREFVNAVTRW